MHLVRLADDKWVHYVLSSLCTTVLFIAKKQIIQYNVYGFILNINWLDLRLIQKTCSKIAQTAEGCFCDLHKKKQIGEIGFWKSFLYQRT